jgi:hypothetical protein
MAKEAKVEVVKSAVELAAEGPDSGRKAYPFAHRAYVCNITDIDWPPIDFDYGRFAIKGVKAGEEYAVTLITARLSTMDHGEKNVTRVPIGALDIAHDLCRMINENAGSVDEQTGAKPFVGVFVIEGPEPTRAELHEAREKLKAFCEHFVFIADADFEVFRNSKFIPGFARRAAKILNLDKPYAIDTQRMVQCPVCRKGVAPETIKCPHCDAVLDEAKARKYFPQLYAAAAPIPAK